MISGTSDMKIQDGHCSWDTLAKKQRVRSRSLMSLSGGCAADLNHGGVTDRTALPMHSSLQTIVLETYCRYAHNQTTTRAHANSDR